MPRPTKWDREVADAVWAKLQELADANGQTSPRAFVAAVRKDATALVEALIEDAIKHHEASADGEPWDDDAVLPPEVERQIADAHRNDDLALRDSGY